MRAGSWSQTDESGYEIVGRKQYSSRSNSAVRSRVEEAGGEERRDESVVCKRLEGMEESRLVKMMVEKLREDREIGQWEEYKVLRRNFELDNKGGLVGKSKNKMKARNEKDREEIYTKSTLK